VYSVVLQSCPGPVLGLCEAMLPIQVSNPASGPFDLTSPGVIITDDWWGKTLRKVIYIYKNRLEDLLRGLAKRGGITTFNLGSWWPAQKPKKGGNCSDIADGATASAATKTSAKGVR
jgi:hypothetical protein